MGKGGRMGVMISYGGWWLDTDDSTQLTLTWTSDILTQGNGERTHSLTLTVPATTRNNGIISNGNSPAFTGERLKRAATVTCDGVILEGSAVVTTFSGGRYSLLFLLGTEEGLQRELSSILAGANIEPLTYTRKDEVGKTTPTWGFIDYENGEHAAGSVGDGVTPNMFPAVNLGYLIEQAASALGYSVRIDGQQIDPAGNTDPRNPYYYNMILDKMESTQEDTVTVENFAARKHEYEDAPPTITTGSGATLADLGLALGIKQYKRSAFNLPVRVYCFIAQRALKIKFPRHVNVAVAGGKGLEFFGNQTAQGRPSWNAHEVELSAGQWFTFGRDAVEGDFGTIFGGNKWNDDAFEFYLWSGAGSGGSSYTFTVSERGQVLTENISINLQDNLPDMTLEELLAAFCRITCGGFTVNGSVIDIYTFDGCVAEVLATGAQVTDADGVVSVGEVLRYVEGYAKRNGVKTKDADYVTEGFARSYEMVSDAVEEEKDIAEIPFNSGQCLTTYVAEFQDVQTASNGTQYKGCLSIVCNEPLVSRPAHLRVVDGLHNLHAKFSEWLIDADEVRVSVLLPLTRWRALGVTSAVSLFGRAWLVKETTWSGGVADLTLCSIDL